MQPELERGPRHDPAARVTKEELIGLVRSGAAQIVNVLEPPAHGRLRMIPRSRNIPLPVLEQRMQELDRRREVITYCANRECDASRLAAELLRRAGYAVRAYEGGIEEWVKSGLPTEPA